VISNAAREHAVLWAGDAMAAYLLHGPARAHEVGDEHDVAVIDL